MLEQNPKILPPSLAVPSPRSTASSQGWSACSALPRVHDAG